MSDRLDQLAGSDRAIEHADLIDKARRELYRGDAGNTPTTVIRAGLLMAKLTSTGELEEWVSTATDGTQDIFGVTPYELRAQDFDATDQDRVAGIIVRAPFKASQLLIQGAAFVGHADIG